MIAKNNNCKYYCRERETDRRFLHTTVMVHVLWMRNLFSLMLRYPFYRLVMCDRILSSVFFEDWFRKRSRQPSREQKRSNAESETRRWSLWWLDGLLTSRTSAPLPQSAVGRLHLQGRLPSQKTTLRNITWLTATYVALNVIVSNYIRPDPIR